jgi:hypothetical protein
MTFPLFNGGWKQMLGTMEDRAALQYDSWGFHAAMQREYTGEDT